LGARSTLVKRGILKTPSPTLMTAEEKRRQQARIKLEQQSLRDLFSIFSIRVTQGQVHQRA